MSTDVLVVSRGAAIKRLKEVGWEMLPNSCLRDMLRVLFKSRPSFVVQSGQYEEQDNEMLDKLEVRFREED